MQYTALVKPARKKSFLNRVLGQKQLVIMTLPLVIYILIFNYQPIWGWLMAFQNYNPAKGIKGSSWVGLRHFRELFETDEFVMILRNTICINLLTLVVGFVAAIALAVMICEIRNVAYKKLVQTISYLPHFISWVVVSSFVIAGLSMDGGIINIVLLKLGIVKEPVLWLAKPNYFWLIAALTDTWKEVGWNAIIYIAAIAGISPDLYEAANMDGASRLQKIFSITIPEIAPTICIMLILNSGWLISNGFEQILLMKNPMVSDVAEILPTYILKFGYNLGNYSYATAAGIFQSVVSLIILTVANFTAKRYDNSFRIM